MQPFPHVLTHPKFRNDFLLRFVQQDDVMESELIFEHAYIQENLKTRELEAVYRVYVIKAINEKRPARGEWDVDPWPTYFHCKGEFIGFHFKSDLQFPLIPKPLTLLPDVEETKG